MEQTNVEMCTYCGDFLFARSTTLVWFGEYDYEMTSEDDTTFPCRGCGQPLHRFHGFLESYRRKQDEFFLGEIRQSLSEILSNTELDILIELISAVNVPSFTVGVKDHPEFLRELSSLESKRFINLVQVGRRPDARFFVVVNAMKTGLFDYPDILSLNHTQDDFNYEIPSNNLIHSRRRTIRKDSLINDFTDLQRDELIKRFDGKCALTGKDVPIHLDHVIPLAVGHGGTTKANMLPIWRRINSSKGARNIFEWYEDSGQRFDVCPQRFKEVIAYLSDLNGMTVDEYREYVYKCHDSPIDTLTKKECV